MEDNAHGRYGKSYLRVEQVILCDIANGTPASGKNNHAA